MCYSWLIGLDIFLNLLVKMYVYELLWLCTHVCRSLRKPDKGTEVELEAVVSCHLGAVN